MCEYCKLTMDEKIRLNIEIVKLERKYRPPQGADITLMLERARQAEAEIIQLFIAFGIKDKRTQNGLIIRAAGYSVQNPDITIEQIEQEFNNIKGELGPDFKSAGMDF